MESSRSAFEYWVLKTRVQTQPWSLIERSSSGEGYLDLYTQKRWEGWQAGYQKQWEGWQAGYIAREKAESEENQW